MSIIALSAATVQAAEPQINIPIDTVIRGDVNSMHVLEKQDVDRNLIGNTCKVYATAKNQHSVHPGNDLIISSNSSSVVLKNVEREANGLTTANGNLILGNKLAVTLKLGQDKVFSGGMTVKLECKEPPKYVEVCRDGKIVTIREDKVRETDTKTCPVKEVEICRDGKIITIPETEIKESDTKTCPVEEKYVEVCRDGKIVKIKEADRKSTDTDVCPVETPVELPKTGSVGVLALFAGSSIFATLAHAFVARRS